MLTHLRNGKRLINARVLKVGTKQRFSTRLVMNRIHTLGEIQEKLKVKYPQLTLEVVKLHSVK